MLYIKNNIDLGLLMIFLRLKARKLRNKNYSIEWSLKKVFHFFRESMAVFEYLQLEQFPQNDQVQQFSVWLSFLLRPKTSIFLLLFSKSNFFQEIFFATSLLPLRTQWTFCKNKIVIKILLPFSRKYKQVTHII